MDVDNNLAEYLKLENFQKRAVLHIARHIELSINASKRIEYALVLMSAK